MNDEYLCDRCEEQPADDLHECPFKSEIDDDKTLCNCCSECTMRCADEI